MTFVIPNLFFNKKLALITEGDKMIIKLNTISDVKAFSTTCSYYEEDIYVTQGMMVTNGRSILGLFSLELNDPIEVKIATDDARIEETFYNTMKKWQYSEYEE